MKTKAHNGLFEFLDLQVSRGILSNQDLQELKEGKKQFKTDELFIRKQLTALAGVIEFITENDVTKNCVTNLSKGSIPEEKNIVADKIGIRFGYSATNIPAEAVAYSNAIYSIADNEFDSGNVATGDTVYARAIPVQFQNAEYIIRADGIVLDNGRVEDFLTQNISNDGVNGHVKNFKELEYPVLFLSGKKMTVDFKFPETAGFVPPVGFFYAEVVIKGLGLGKRQVL